MEKITAVVVTYNRINCLKKVIDSLHRQTHKIDNVIVVDNGSTDETKKWLDNQVGLHIIHQENVGGSGGFYRGLQEALKFENDWVWCMDDDVYPRPDCLEQLLNAQYPKVGILCPQRIQNGKVFVSEFKKLNLSNPFRNLHQQVLTLADINKNIPIEIEGMVFEGPLIKHEVVDKIGLPTKDFFLFYDDTDYSYRAVVCGYKVVYVSQAKMDKEYFHQGLTRNEMLHKNRWKTWYHIRNTSYFCKNHAKNRFFGLIGGIGLPIHMLLAISFNLLWNKKYDFKDLGKVITMYVNGRKGILGKIN